MELHRAQRIRAALTPKRAELFDLMCNEVAAGRWAELDERPGLLTIRWMAERKVADAYRAGPDPCRQRTWHEIVFVSLVTLESNPLLGHCSGPFSGRRDSGLTVGRALAVVRDPVAALELDPVPVLRWRLAWAPGTDQAGHEPLSFATEAEVLPERFTDGIAAGHAARHAVDDGLVELGRQLNAASCRFCHASHIPGRDVMFHPAAAEIVEEVPGHVRA